MRMTYHHEDLFRTSVSVRSLPSLPSAYRWNGAAWTSGLPPPKGPTALTWGALMWHKKYYRKKITHKTSKNPEEQETGAHWRLQAEANYILATSCWLSPLHTTSLPHSPLPQRCLLSKCTKTTVAESTTTFPDPGPTMYTAWLGCSRYLLLHPYNSGAALCFLEKSP